MRTLSAILFLLAGIYAANSEEKYVAPGHHHFHHWYQTIQEKLGIWGCCDKENNDCGPVADFKDLGIGGARVLLPDDSKWHYTDKAKKYYVDTPDGRAHVCRQPEVNSFGRPVNEFRFFCVFLPNPVGKREFMEEIMDATLRLEPAPTGAGFAFRIRGHESLCRIVR